MAAFTMQLTDGTTTINFDGTDGYSLIDSSWAPQRAQRNEGEMGHVYEDVIETIPIVITGGSPAHVMQRYAALSDLLDQAEVWGKDDAGVDAVLFKYQPNGSTLADPLETPIWREPGSPRMLSAPSTTNEAGYRGNVLTPVIVTFTRIGLLLGATEAKSSSISTGNPAIVTTATFTDTPKIPVPYDMYIKFDFPITNTKKNIVYGLMTNSADKLNLNEAEGMGLGSGVSSETVSGSSAGSVARFASTATTEKQIYDSSPTINNTSFSVALFITALNNSATVSWDIWGAVVSKSYTEVGVKTRIAAGDNDRQIVDLGSFGLPNEITTIYVRAQNDITGTPPGDDLEIDIVAVVAVDENLRIWHSNAGGVSSQISYLEIYHRLNSHKKPTIYGSNTQGNPVEYAAYGEDISLAASGNSISALVFGMMADGTTWVITNTIDPELDVTLTVTRTMGYLTPL